MTHSTHSGKARVYSWVCWGQDMVSTRHVMASSASATLPPDALPTPPVGNPASQSSVTLSVHTIAVLSAQLAVCLAVASTICCCTCPVPCCVAAGAVTACQRRTAKTPCHHPVSLALPFQRTHTTSQAPGSCLEAHTLHTPLPGQHA